MYDSDEEFYRPQVPDRKMRGSRIVIIGLIMGAVQALFTIPRGGGIACFVVSGGLVGGIGMVVVAVKNDLEGRVRTGAYIGAVIFFVALLLSAYQLVLKGQIEEDMDEINEESDNINSGNWKQKKGALVDDMNVFIDDMVLFIILLAVSTGLLAVAATTHILLSEHEKKNLMLIPMALFIATIVLVPILTHTGIQGFRDVLDDLDEAESDDELRAVADDAREVDAEDAIIGSQVGGVINLINLILVIMLFIQIKPPLEEPEDYYQTPYEAYEEYSPTTQHYRQHTPFQHEPQYGHQQPSRRQLPPPPESMRRVCGVCKAELRFIPQYKRYYCYTCEEYR